MPVHVAHPNKVRSFARAAGYEAKTDILDARVLSRYGEVFELDSTPADDGEGQMLASLLKRRKQLVNQRVQERNRLDKGLCGGVRRSTERHIEWLDKEIACLDAEYRKALRDNAQLSETAALYQSVPGVGELTAASLVAHLPKSGELRCQVIDLSGGTGTLVQGHWEAERVVPHYPRRAWGGASKRCTWRRCRRYATTRR